MLKHLSVAIIAGIALVSSVVLGTAAGAGAASVAPPADGAITTTNPVTGFWEYLYGLENDYAGYGAVVYDSCATTDNVIFGGSPADAFVFALAFVGNTCISWTMGIPSPGGILANT